MKLQIVPIITITHTHPTLCILTPNIEESFLKVRKETISNNAYRLSFLCLWSIWYQLKRCQAKLAISPRGSCRSSIDSLRVWDASQSILSFRESPRELAKSKRRNGASIILELDCFSRDAWKYCPLPKVDRNGAINRIEFSSNVNCSFNADLLTRVIPRFFKNLPSNTSTGEETSN